MFTQSNSEKKLIILMNCLNLIALKGPFLRIKQLILMSLGIHDVLGFVQVFKETLAFFYVAMSSFLIVAKFCRVGVFQLQPQGCYFLIE